MSSLLPNPVATKSAALEARGLTLTRGRRAVLRNVDFTLASGEIMALLGANGAGKTTLLQCLAGVLRPAAGQVVWLGEPLRREPGARRRIGYLSHEIGLYRELTARENLVFAGRMAGLADVARRVAAMLRRIGLEGQAHQAVARLSCGMQRRLAIARATIHHPPILLLDEPFANLDSDSRQWLSGFLGELRANRCAVCLTSHDPQHSGRIADRLIWLRDGRLHAAEGQRHAA
jgi:heme ABC exporter ATP-binding subunit CcmA